MRFSKNLFYDTISQWKDCYIDYQYLKIYIAVIQEIMTQVNDYEQKIQEHTQKDSDEITRKIQSDYVLQLNGTILELKSIVIYINQLFNKAYINQIIICKLFCHIKSREIHQRILMCFKFGQIASVQQEKKVLIPYIQYTYIQAVYLNKMIQSNIESERKILKKIKKNIHNIAPIHSSMIQEQFKNISKKTQSAINKIQDYYIQKVGQIQKKRNRKKKKTKVKRDYLRNLAERSQVTNKDSFIFGLWVGLFVAVIVFMSLLLVYKNKGVQTDPIFNRDFPTWRGIAFIIFYIWMIGLDIYFFQQFMISHQLIFQFNQHHNSSSTEIFKVAGLLSTVFAALFTVYALHISTIINLESFPSHFLVLFIWAIFIFGLLNPFPIINFRSRIFILKTFVRIVISPCIGVPFYIGWATDQLVSLITPFEDMIYTICYYTSINFLSQQVQVNPCKDVARIAVFAYSATVLSYRIFQCMRQGYDKKKYWRQFQFYNTLKYMASLLTLILSFLWKSGNSNIFAAWLSFTIVSTLYSYFWDLKVDWALLDRNAQYRFLRRKITYPFYVYYIIMGLNLILRLAWVLTLSPNIAQKTFGSPQIFRLVTGLLQIFRRGLWNLLRVQKQQIKLRQQLKPIPSIRNKYEELIKTSITNNEHKFGGNSLERISSLDIYENQSNVQKIPSEQQIKKLKEQIIKNSNLKNQLLKQLRTKKKSAREIIRSNRLTIQ